MFFPPRHYTINFLIYIILVFFSAVFPAWHCVSRKVWFLQYVCETLLWCPWSLLQRRASFWHKVFWCGTKSIWLKRCVTPSPSPPSTVLTKYPWVVCHKISHESLDWTGQYALCMCTTLFTYATEIPVGNRISATHNVKVRCYTIYSSVQAFGVFRFVVFSKHGMNKTNKHTSLQNCCTL